MANQTFHITTNSEGMRTDIVAPHDNELIVDEPANMGGTNKGADPLSTLLASLAGCENVIANMVAKEMDFDLQNIKFDIKGSLDPRGLMGDESVRPYFQTVEVNATIETSESEERIKELQEKTDARCPVYTTLQAAGVELTPNWVKA
ncbi:osmotically inducible protein C [Pontibacillus halophilus JSM 076056 = DSM 19796]|uniref:Osmotically inducible protein C n=1 Tax=Pontibacillus halophilus JSM 076056 = DSM 19796 TaxID=1385510 RepID=A0A0A5GBJ4_9BACI|nr:OsmC family protein [Pontibacillus halophilus]KGX90531.1 osmotically inducible protein C [Pontibacillus halophilus JSM 076056 = DSM 19796]